MSPSDSIDLGEDRSLLLVDDDEPFLRRLAKAMEKRGFEVETAGSVVAGRAIATARPPAYAVVDLRLEDGNGLDVVEVLREKRPDSRIVVLTGYGAIATAVAAVKIGATDYLAKPADATDITNALVANGDDLPPPPENPMSADRVRWEHIQRVYELCDRNVSETERRLNMHRRQELALVRAIRDFHDPGNRDMAGPQQVLDVVLLEKEFNPASHAIAHTTGPGHHLLEIDRKVLHVHPEFGGVRNAFNRFSRFQEGLGGNTSPVQARSSRPLNLDAGDFLAQLTRANSRGITSRTTANDH